MSGVRFPHRPQEDSTRMRACGNRKAQVYFGQQSEIPSQGREAVRATASTELLTDSYFKTIMKNTEKAFHWIIDILEKNEIQYKISGGFAARVHGVERELADIDIEILDNDIDKITEEVASYIQFGPGRYKDNDWDLELMTLSYEGQEIDIAGTGAKIFNKQTHVWEKISSNLDSIETKEVFGRVVPIESRASLILYKGKIGREVDLEDIRQLSVK